MTPLLTYYEDPGLVFSPFAGAMPATGAAFQEAAVNCGPTGEIMGSHSRYLCGHRNYAKHRPARIIDTRADR